MIYETKYNIGDIVYTIIDNSLCELTLEEVVGLDLNWKKSFQWKATECLGVHSRSVEVYEKDVCPSIEGLKRKLFGDQA